MTDITPRKMLQEYRLQSDDFTNEQSEAFNKMPVTDKIELLFYMLMHTNKIMQYLHNRIEPDRAKIVDIEEIETPTQ